MKFDNIKKQEQAILEKERALVKNVGQKRETLFQKFPLIFTLGGTFGLVATFYGFEKIIDKIDFLSDNPWILLGAGLATLTVTGSLYNKLQ